MSEQTLESALKDGFEKQWWVFLLRGLLLIALGFAVLAWPLQTLPVLVFAFGVYAFVSGAVQLGYSFGRRSPHRPALAAQGVLGIVIGVLTFRWPGVTVVALYWLIGVWALITGVTEFVIAGRVRGTIANEVLLILGGICSVLLGLIIFARPAMGIPTAMLLIGFYGLIAGAISCTFAFRIKKGEALRTPPWRAVPQP